MSAGVNVKAIQQRMLAHASAAMSSVGCQQYPRAVVHDRADIAAFSSGNPGWSTRA